LPSGQYDVAGFWIRDVPAIYEWFNRMVQEWLFPLLVKQFPHFCLDNAYVFKYTPKTGRQTDVHAYSGCLSFTIALNGNDEYSDTQEPTAGPTLYLARPEPRKLQKWDKRRYSFFLHYHQDLEANRKLTINRLGQVNKKWSW
jgi:hypothetical protein